MTVGVVVDIVLAVLCVVLIIKHTVMGGIKSIFSYFKVFLAVGTAYLLRSPVALMIDGLFMNRSITDWVYESLLSSSMGVTPEGVDFVSLYNNTPSFFTDILSKFGIDLTGFGDAIGSLQYATEEDIRGMAENIGSPLSMLLSTVIAVIAIFVIALILYSLLVKLLDKIMKLPVLNIINRILGVAFGILMAATTLVIASALANMLVTYVGPIAPEVFNSDIIEGSVLLSFMSKWDIVDLIASYIG